MFGLFAHSHIRRFDISYGGLMSDFIENGTLDGCEKNNFLYGISVMPGKKNPDSKLFRSIHTTIK